MINKASRSEIREKKHRRLRHHLNGTATTPRLAVFRSNKHIYAQIIDDTVGKTLVSASTLQKDVKAELENTDDVQAAAKVGTVIGKKAVEAGIESVVFDRGGYIYHGKVKSTGRCSKRSWTEILRGGKEHMKRNLIDASQLELEDKVVSIKRVTKVVKGGRNFRFTALVVVGDGNGHVGAGLGKAAEIPEAIRKGKEDAMKKLVTVARDENNSITHDFIGKFGSAEMLLKRAPEGTGVIAGGPARAVIELAGIKNIRTKCMGSRNKQNVVWQQSQA